MSINQNRLIRRFIALTEIDSPSFREREMADYLKRELKRLAVVVHEDDCADRIGGNAGNIYGYLPAKDTQARENAAPLLFLAHMDTVEPACSRKAVVHEDGRITSDGTTVLGADDQAALAVLLEVIQELQEENADHPPLEFLFAAAEEAYTVGASAMDLSVFQAKEAFALDLSDETGGYSVQEPTLISFTIQVHGKASHAGFDPEDGISAITAASRAIARIPQGRINDHATFNIGMIQGGTGTNIIPESAEVRGELRCTVHEEALQMYEDAVRIFREEAEAMGASVSAEKTVHLKAYHVEDDDPALRRYKRAAEMLGYSVFPVKTFGGSDVNVLRRNGIAGLCISGAMHNVHTTSEYTTVQELTEAAEIVKQIMTE
jgi:tripeptide aminopeptidase